MKQSTYIDLIGGFALILILLFMIITVQKEKEERARERGINVEKAEQNTFTIAKTATGTVQTIQPIRGSSGKLPFRLAVINITDDNGSPAVIGALISDSAIKEKDSILVSYYTDGSKVDIRLGTKQ